MDVPRVFSCSLQFSIIFLLCLGVFFLYKLVCAFSLPAWVSLTWVSMSYRKSEQERPSCEASADAAVQLGGQTPETGVDPLGEESTVFFADWCDVEREERKNVFFPDFFGFPVRNVAQDTSLEAVWVCCFFWVATFFVKQYHAE